MWLEFDDEDGDSHLVNMARVRRAYRTTTIGVIALVFTNDDTLRVAVPLSELTRLVDAVYVFDPDDVEE